MLRKLSILEIILFATFITTVLIGIQVFLFSKYYNQALNSKQVIADTYQLTAQIQSLFSRVQDAELAQRGFIITGNEYFLEGYKKALSKNNIQGDPRTIDIMLQQLLSTTQNSPILKQQFNELNNLINRKLLYLQETMELRKYNAMKVVMSRVESDEGKPLTDAIRQAVAKLMNTEKQIMVARSQQDALAEKNFIRLMLLLLLLNYFIISIEIFLVIRGFIRLRDAKEAQQASDNNFKMLFDLSPDAYTLFTDDFHIIDCNQAALELFNCSSKTQLLSSAIDNLWPKDQPDGRDSLEKIKNILDTNTHQQFEWLCKRIDGLEFLTEVTINKVTMGDRQILLASWREITERKHLEEALRNSQIQLDLAISGTSYGLWDWNILTGEVYYSPRFLEIVGYNPGELPSNLQSFTNLLNPDDVMKVYAAIDRHTLDHAPFNIEFRLRHKAGDYVWCNAIGQAIWDTNGTATRMAGFVTDITQQREINRMRNEFISTVSHELRTPVTSINGSLSLLDSGVMGALPPPVASLIEVAYRNSQRLLLLINDILDIDKLEIGLMNFETKNESVNTTLIHAKEMNEAYGIKLQIQIEAHPLEPDGIIKVDPHRFMQVLSNLIANAIKFSTPGNFILLKAIRNDGKIRIIVEDYGSGIPAAFQPHIFKMFSQAENSVKAQKGGTGLGLYISKKLTEKMHGTIGFKSVPNKHTQFWVEFDEVIY